MLISAFALQGAVTHAVAAIADENKTDTFQLNLVGKNDIQDQLSFMWRKNSHV